MYIPCLNKDDDDDDDDDDDYDDDDEVEGVRVEREGAHGWLI